MIVCPLLPLAFWRMCLGTARCEPHISVSPQRVISPICYRHTHTIGFANSFIMRHLTHSMRYLSLIWRMSSIVFGSFGSVLQVCIFLQQPKHPKPCVTKVAQALLLTIYFNYLYCLQKLYYTVVTATSSRVDALVPFHNATFTQRDNPICKRKFARFCKIFTLYFLT